MVTRVTHNVGQLDLMAALQLFGNYAKCNGFIKFFKRFVFALLFPYVGLDAKATSLICNYFSKYCPNGSSLGNKP